MDRLYEVNATAYNSCSFKEFMINLILKIEEMNLGNCIFIMDNATIHRNLGVREVIDASNHRIQYLPPYSPFLNPIEECFSKWKGFVKSLNVWNEDELLAGILEGFRSVREWDCEAYVRNMHSFLVRCKNNEEI